MTQAAQILAALQAGEALTPLDALSRFGCLRLGARIWDLRSEGWPITSHPFTTASGKIVSKYRLEQNQSFRLTALGQVEEEAANTAPYIPRRQQ